MERKPRKKQDVEWSTPAQDKSSEVKGGGKEHWHKMKGNRWRRKACGKVG
jgi:hypothetical protein